MKRRYSGARLIGFVGGLVIAAGGCRQEGPVLYPVSGQVTLNGQPLPQVGVSFRPDESEGESNGHIPTGVADAEGRYRLETVGRQGAPPGRYKVVVLPYSPGPVSPVPPPPFAATYLDPKTTDLTVEVKKDAPPGTYDLPLRK